MRHGWTVLYTLIILWLGLCGFTRHAHGSEPTDDRLGIRTVPILLLTRADVQTDLILEPKQVAACQRAVIALYDRALRLKGRKDAGAQAARQAIDREMSLWLSNYLSPEQLRRLEQIDLQWEGAAAMLSRPVLDEGLNLTPTQRKSLSELISQSKAQRTQGAWSYDDHIDLTRKAIAILTDRQRNLWIHLLGRPCRFTIGVKTAQNPPAVRVSSRPSPTGP